MKSFLQLLVMETASIICAAAAALLAFEGKDGWGWFLIVAMLTGVSSTTTTRVTDDKKEGTSS